VRSVIIVDDDAATAEMYRLGLEAAGYTVVVAPDADGLFRTIDRATPDIIVLDWQLPGMRGDEILQHIRIDPRTRALPVFMLSNHLGDQDGAIDRVFLAGALAWLEKAKTPPSLLADKVTEVLGPAAGS